MAAPAQPNAPPRRGTLDRTEHHRGATARARAQPLPGDERSFGLPAPPSPFLVASRTPPRPGKHVGERPTPTLSSAGDCGRSPICFPGHASHLSTTGTVRKNVERHPTPPLSSGRKLRELPISFPTVTTPFPTAQHQNSTHSPQQLLDPPFDERPLPCFRPPRPRKHVGERPTPTLSSAGDCGRSPICFPGHASHLSTTNAV